MTRGCDDPTATPLAFDQIPNDSALLEQVLQHAA
jgi:hypothetical protein